MKLNIQYYPQHTDYSCGPACLRMVMEHLGKEFSEEALISKCHTGAKYGTSHQHLIAAIKQEGFETVQKTNSDFRDLINAIDKGYFAIVNYLEPFSDESHYAVVTGYTKGETAIILADPCNGNDFTVAKGDFMQMWCHQKLRSRGWFVILGREFVVY